MLRISEQLFRDVMITAIHGGIDYWGFVTVADGHVMKLDDPAPPDTVAEDTRAYCQVVEHEPSEGTRRKSKVLSRDIMQQGLERILSKGFALNRETLFSIVEGVKEDDAGYIDAVGADVLVQASMFGEIVYS